MREYEDKLGKLKKQVLELQLDKYCLEERLERALAHLPADRGERCHEDVRWELDRLRAELDKGQELLVAAAQAMEVMQRQHGEQTQQLQDRVRELEEELAVSWSEPQLCGPRGSDARSPSPSPPPTPPRQELVAALQRDIGDKDKRIAELESQLRSERDGLRDVRAELEAERRRADDAVVQLRDAQEREAALAAEARDLEQRARQRESRLEQAESAHRKLREDHARALAVVARLVRRGRDQAAELERREREHLLQRGEERDELRRLQGILLHKDLPGGPRQELRAAGDEGGMSRGSSLLPWVLQGVSKPGAVGEPDEGQGDRVAALHCGANLSRTWRGLSWSQRHLLVNLVGAGLGVGVGQGLGAGLRLLLGAGEPDPPEESIPEDAPTEVHSPVEAEQTVSAVSLPEQRVDRSSEQPDEDSERVLRAQVAMLQAENARLWSVVRGAVSGGGGPGVKGVRRRRCQPRQKPPALPAPTTQGDAEVATMTVLERRGHCGDGAASDSSASTSAASYPDPQMSLAGSSQSLPRSSASSASATTVGRLRDAWVQLEEARQLCVQMECQLTHGAFPVLESPRPSASQGTTVQCASRAPPAGPPALAAPARPPRGLSLLQRAQGRRPSGAPAPADMTPASPWPTPSAAWRSSSGCGEAPGSS